MALAAIEKSQPPVIAPQLNPPRDRWRHWTTAMGIFAAAAVWLALLFVGLSGTPASAAVELNRIIAATARTVDRTFKISVEDSALPALRKRSEEMDGRPPKPPLGDAVLHVRGGHQFVLIRKTSEGLPFVTGSNGQSSWAVRPNGPVRVSPDLTRFNHDVPGHEHAMPLSSIEEDLGRLREAYVVEVLPVERYDEETGPGVEATRLMVAVKTRGFRGPKRVEITYSVESGQIRQMRFIEMPYGPDRLTLRITLIEQRPLGANFFDHSSHHDADRVVEQEE